MGASPFETRVSRYGTIDCCHGLDAAVDDEADVEMVLVAGHGELQAVPEVERFPEVVRDYRSRFHTVLLDEYQDTNVAQATLIGRLFGEGFPVTAVGDPDQSIYAWRGASLFNLLEFPMRSQQIQKRDLPVAGH